MGRFAHTIGTLVVLGSLSSCGSLTYDLWDHGGDKHWMLEEYRFAAEVVNGGASSQHAMLFLSCGDEALPVAWKRLAREHEHDVGTHLELLGDHDAAFLTAVLTTPVDGELTSRLTITHHRDEAGLAQTQAVLSAHGMLPTYDTLRPWNGEPGGAPDPNPATRCALALRCLALPGFSAWREALGAAGSPLRWIGLRSDAGSDVAVTQTLETALERHDLRTLRRLWLQVAWSGAEIEHHAEVRADLLAYARAATTALGNGFVSWDASVTLAPNLVTEARTSRPSSTLREPERSVRPRVRVSLQRKELVRRAGLSTPVRIVLTPVALAADIVTLGIAVRIADWFEENQGVCVTFEWDPVSHRFMPVIE